MPDAPVTNLNTIIKSYKEDKESVYNTWFIDNEDRLKAFRSVRRGVQKVIQEIKEEKFGNDFKGSSLEFVLSAITEQKQVFEGASHPFCWKPKLRIPDIYENESNKRAFGQFLESCLHKSKDSDLIQEIEFLSSLKIKGLGPAVANILYFLHPTIFPPFNTAIVRGFNLLFKEKRKLGSWNEYLYMREVIIRSNKEVQGLLSNDLGGFTGLLFDIGVNKIVVSDIQGMTEKELSSIQRLIKKRHEEVNEENLEESLHTEMQYHLLKIGNALGYDVIAAANDRSRRYKENIFSFVSLNKVPQLNVDNDTFNTINLIDILWFEKETNNIVCAFEIEKSTSIYSGILRLVDLAASLPESLTSLYIVIPDSRKKDLLLQLNRPSVKSLQHNLHYILFSDLKTHCDALCKFGDSHEIMKKIAQRA